MTSVLRIWGTSVLVAFAAACGLAQGPVMGRYVRVEIPKEKATLIIAEVQVFSKGENVARKGLATQSGTDHGAAAERAIDGNTDGIFNNKSVAHTAEAACPWWEVDLGAAPPVEKIVIWNRADYPEKECFMRLNGCRVVILDAERKEVWEQTIPEPGKVTELEVNAPPPPAVATASATVPELQKYQEIFGKTLAGLMAEQKAQARALSDKYLSTLKLLQERAKRAGNLDYLLALTAETVRVTQSQPVMANAEQDVKFAELKGVRDAYLGALRTEDGKAARKIAGLAQQYAKTLAALQADLTRKDRISDATAVKAEREGVDGRPEVAWAKAVLADVAPAAPPVLAPAATGTSAGKKDLYMVIDLSRGTKAKKYPVKYLDDMPKSGWDDEYKTEKLVLRRIEPGTFMMGSPEDELGHMEDESQHKVTLTKPFYIGVFEVTQRQWELVMGSRPGFFEKDKASRPVERVRYTDIRGNASGANWPSDASVDVLSFMGGMRARTGLERFDLPTEAQWEYACRAGTSTALNSGKNLTDKKKCPNVADMVRCAANSVTGDPYVAPAKGGTAVVGSYPPNAWGLCEMHGNVLEWCLDRYGAYAGDASDPVGVPSGDQRVVRGGSWWTYESGYAADCRSACRCSKRPDYGGKDVHHGYGFRVALTLL